MTGDNRRVPIGVGPLSAAVGDHIGHFYETPQERTDLAVSFLTAGLRAGDKCVYLMPPRRRRDLESALEEAGTDPEALIAAGQLRLEEGADAPETMQALLAEALRDVPERYPILRWGADMTWSLGKMPTTEKLMEWETHCNIFDAPPALFLCQYDLTTFRGNVVMDALKTHPTCVVSNVLHQNPYYESPEAFLEVLRERASAPLAG